jgi:hypothetical protein
MKAELDGQQQNDQSRRQESDRTERNLTHSTKPPREQLLQQHYTRFCKDFGRFG